MSESASPVKVCFNPQCGASVAEKWRKGWTLRSGEIVDFCDRCGAAYEEQRFCEDFHADAAGWRNCETCGKRLHCGCIASAHRYYLLDAGGVECLMCANKNGPGVTQSLFRPPSWFPSLSHLDGLTDQCLKTWGQNPVTGSDLRQQQQLPLVWQYMSQYSEPHPGIGHPDAGKPRDRFPGLGSSKETQNQISITRSYTEGKVKNEAILSRYCPRITVQELQKISGNSNSVVTPLFEKMLSASDAGRVGRLVLPKKCAEAYFPAISHPEGLPLRIQDANGKEWVFQFRFWPNNNSRMYVLEGVTSCIQSMQLQAGDIVTFSRIDPEGKLVMGFRKASSTLSHQDARSSANQNGEVPNRIGGFNEVVTALPAYSAKGAFDSTRDSSCDQFAPASVASKPKTSSASSAFFLDKRKKRTCGSKRKHLSIDDENSAKIKPTWEDAQKLLQPPANHSPTIVVIEGHEFEEYEEPPVLGNRPIFAAKQLGSSCSTRGVSVELQSRPAKSEGGRGAEPEKLSEGLTAHNDGRAGRRMKSDECLSKLDTLADLAILDVKGQEQHPPANSTTTKHPRHRPGCSCIVCVQPRSGQGPKHEPDCKCNVCLMVKRRFQTLMLRRKRLQSEKEAENDEGNHQCLPEESVVESERQGDKPIKKSSDLSRNSGNGEGPLPCSPYNKENGVVVKGQIEIDLNCQPEREEDDLPSTSKPFNEYVWMGMSCPLADEQGIETHAADPVDGQSKDVANVGQELEWQDADAGVSGMANLSNPGPISATTAA
ncbi:unnamed protein product [Victoria cruziana]